MPRASSSSKAGPSRHSGSGGDGQFVAQLSRRIKACDECRRHKIRCNLPADGNPPCDRCIKNGIDCQLTKSLQSILDDRQSDKAWKDSVESRLDAIVRAIEGSTSTQAMRDLQLIMKEQKEQGGSVPAISSRGAKRRRMESVMSDSQDELSLGLGLLADAASVDKMTPQKQHWEDEELADPAYAPGDHLRQLAQVHGASTPAAQFKEVKRKAQPDVIDQGIITLEQACTLLELYLEHLDKKAYSMVSRNHSSSNGTSIMLWSVRKSTLLVAAICTVASLHCNEEISRKGVKIGRGDTSAQASNLHTSLYNEFVRVSAQQSFARHQSLDDIRALIIGSLWLRELSWILTASAVRLVTERGMQDAFKKCADMVAGKAYVAARGEEAKIRSGEAGVKMVDLPLSSQEISSFYKEAVLHYQVYVADHQAAIPFSKPPMTRQHAAVRNARIWLAGCCILNEEDTRLIADVELWQIAHDIVDDLGVDVHEPLTDHQVLELASRYKHLIERLKKRWDWYPMNDRLDQVDMLHLFLTAHAFRAPAGISPLLIQIDQIGIEGRDHLAHRESMAYTAVPTLASSSSDARQARIQMADTAIVVARTICTNCAVSDPYGEPIYPLVMIIFACLFLNKVARMYDEDVEEWAMWSMMGEDGSSRSLRQVGNKILLKRGEKKRVVDCIERVTKEMNFQCIGKCTSIHFCSSIAHSLAGIASDLERLCRSQATLSKETTTSGILDNGIAMPNLTYDNDTFTAPSDLDLQMLDLLSNTRFISGVDDSSLWFGQDWLASNTTQANMQENPI